MIFVHIGAGAGNLDPSTNFRDGFTEYVKKFNCTKKEIILIEANSLNLKKLKQCWKNYKNVKIYNVAITPNNYKKNKINLYYSLQDKPNYQLLSYDKNHVKKYFPNSKIKKITVKALKINDFLKKNLNNRTIESFSLDIEGLDYKVFMDIDLKKFDIKNISIEYLHLSKIQKKNIIRKFIKNGYSYNGFGIDHNKLDWLFTKKKTLWNNIISKVLPYLHRIYYKRLNKIILNL